MRKFLVCVVISLLLNLLIGFKHPADAQAKGECYIPRKDNAPVSGQPYERYFTQDRFGREITFYLSQPRSHQSALPLIVYIQGSGCGSLFDRKNDRIIPTLGHATFVDVAQGRARILIVEKPGVKFLEQPEGCDKPSQFSREHTLERWAEAIEAALRAARRLPQVNADKVLVIGHSEGGLVACRVARDLPEIVTHVASLAGGGPSQLFDLLTLARQGNFFRNISEEPEARVQYLLSQWREIQADPLSAEKFFFGFAYRRWATFLASSPIEELTQVKARIYLAQGLDDDAVNPVTSDLLYAQLKAHGKQVVYDRVEGADHSFNIKGKPQVNGWQEQLDRTIKWFFQS
jgi:pimeloyl-ACP methyl ester carboxylesterase